MKKFGLTGVAGYVAPKHLKAIKETGNVLVAAMDPHDSVGILDQYFSDTAFFTEIERFDRHLEKLRRGGDGIDYLSICSPNHLHDAHVRLALRNGAHAICEKPIVLNPWNLDFLEKLEEELGKRIYTVLQLRLHPVLIDLKKKLDLKQRPAGKKFNVELSYITSRGKWYDYSWKGDILKSGGVATNIGIHLFDLLIWLFGNPVGLKVESSRMNKITGILELENADVNWFLSTDKADLPKFVVDNNKSTYRLIKIDDDEVEFTDGFSDLHTKVYEDVLAGKGFGIKEARTSIELVYRLRNTIPI